MVVQHFKGRIRIVQSDTNLHQCIGNTKHIRMLHTVNKSNICKSISTKEFKKNSPVEVKQHGHQPVEDDKELVDQGHDPFPVAGLAMFH